MSDKKIDDFLAFDDNTAKENKGAVQKEQIKGPQKNNKKIANKLKVQKGQLGLFAVLCILVLVLCVVVAFKGCSASKNGIIGMWDYDDTTTYRFDNGGKGALVLPLSTYDFDYEIKDDTVSIDFADEKARDSVYTFTVEGNKLTLKRSDEDRVYEFTKRGKE